VSQPPDDSELLDPEAATGSRRSRILGGGRASRHDGRRGVLIAIASTVVVVGVLVAIVVNSPGWDEVRTAFFDGQIFWDSLPGIAEKFLVNVAAFCIAEVFVLVVALLLAVMRSLPGPVFFPIRTIAIVYIDFFRGVPTILVIALLGFGFPALQLQGLPTAPFFWGVLALILVYSAYVAEVYRAGIESVHPSQDAAARSLGLTRFGSLRAVILPQAVRRVIPPLLNDFIGLQKDTALLGIIGVTEAFRQAQLDEAATFNFTPFVALALVFVVFTIPLARLVDWLVARERRRRQAGATV
jgi:polar amino acid transport system permease protein